MHLSAIKLVFDTKLFCFGKTKTNFIPVTAQEAMQMVEKAALSKETSNMFGELEAMARVCYMFQFKITK